MANSTAAVANECSSRCSASELRRKVRVQVKADLSNVHFYKLNLNVTALFQKACLRLGTLATWHKQMDVTRESCHVNQRALT